MPEAHRIFIDYLRGRNLKLTDQRQEILSIFLKTERHVSVEDMYDIVRKKDSAIGHATVFRTLKLLRDAGIAKEVDFGDRIVRYEHKYGHRHHDHLVCVECGSFIEVFDERIEELQDKLCRNKGFLPHRHKMEIYGVCRNCRRKEGN